MQDVFHKYISYLQAERNASHYTVRNYKNDLLNFFDFLKQEGIGSLKDVDKHVIRSYLAHLMDEGFVRTSIARKLSAIRSFFRYLVREEMLAASPAATTSSPKLDRRLPTFLTIDEVERLLEAPNLNSPQGKRDRAIMELLYACGLRVSELAKLNVEQIDLATDEIIVRGKGSKERLVLMGKPAAEALGSYLRKGRPELFGAKIRMTNAVFINRYGGRLTERSVQKMLQEYAGSAGIEKKVHPHLLRHTFATHLLNGGADLRVVQELLGHANLSSTQVYTHVTKSQARKVYMSAHPLAQVDKNELEK